MKTIEELRKETLEAIKEFQKEYPDYNNNKINNTVDYEND